MKGSVVIDLRSHLKGEESRAPLEPRVLADSYSAKPNWHLEACEAENGLVKGRHDSLHPLVHAADIGFSGHYNLSFRPDDFLQPLLSQLSMLRTINGKRVATAKWRLTVRRDDFQLGRPENPWPEVFAEFRQQIKAKIDEGDFVLFQPSFSTTSALLRSGYDVALMDAYQSVFSYHNMFMCGIPSVTLEGTPEDWAAFVEHAERVVSSMTQYVKARGWKEHIMQHIGKIAQCGQGKMSSAEAQEFWCSFYRWKMHSGGAGIDGWIVSFFPVIASNDSPDVEVAPTLEDMYGKLNFGRTRGVDTFPAGCSSAPVTCNDRGREHVLRYIAGQMGVRQSPEGVVAPCWGWAVLSKPGAADDFNGQPSQQVVSVRVECDGCTRGDIFHLSVTGRQMLQHMHLKETKLLTHDNKPLDLDLTIEELIEINGSSLFHAAK